MNNAGRIGFVLKGDYDNTATYDFLDVVYFRNASYVAKKTTIGNEPEDSNEYWQILATSPDTAVTGIKGAAEAEFRAGNVMISPQNIGLGNVDNTPDAKKNVKSADTLNVSSSGSQVQPVYFENGVPVPCPYKLEKSVPSNAVFTDTVYSLPTASSSALGGMKTGYATSGKNYKVQVDNNGNGYVNVPWNNTTYSSLKNPYAITFTGNSTVSYDGSSSKTVAIPKLKKELLWEGEIGVDDNGRDASPDRFSLTIPYPASDYFLFKIYDKFINSSLGPHLVDPEGDDLYSILGHIGALYSQRLISSRFIANGSKLTFFIREPILLTKEGEDLSGKYVITKIIGYKIA